MAESVEYTAKSSHCADPVLQPFLAPTFDAADYLNSILPSLTTNTSSVTSSPTSLADLSTQTQTVLSQLSAYTSRLTNTLTQLTDEILRSGSRLAYEVEILNAQTVSLSETLVEELHQDVSTFVQGGLQPTVSRRASRAADSTRRRSSTVLTSKVNPDAPATQEPEELVQLRTLTEVRAKLDTVIKTFGDAMSWTFPPSELSIASGFISVSAPENESDVHNTEEKGQQVSTRLRTEIADLLNGQDAVEAIEAAAKRVDELKQLSVVWKGTAEEKARTRFVESLAKMVEDKHRDLLQAQEKQSQSSNLHIADGLDETKKHKSQGSFGFMSQLQKMRGAI